MKTELLTGFDVESSASGDTVMVRAVGAITILVRGQAARRLQRASRESGVPVSRLVEELITKELAAAPDAAPDGVPTRVVAATEGKAKSGPEEGGGVASRPRKLVLVVEDDLITNRYYSRLLDEAGYGVVEAKDGPSAIALAMAQRPNLILLDLKLPPPDPRSGTEFDGFSVLRWVRRAESTKAIPVIVVSGMERSVHRDSVRALGAEGYLQKPVTSEQLLSAVRMAVDD